MNYYEIAPLKLNSPILTYQSAQTFQKGDILDIPIKNKILQGVVIRSCEKPNFSCKQAQSTPYYFGKNQIILGDFIAQYYCCTYGEAYGLFVPFEKNTTPIITKTSSHYPNALNAIQKQALENIYKKPLALLFGDTGSGKTEIYIHLIIDTLAQNKNVIFLMPEISLTPQIEARLKKVFGEIVGIWHSKISSKKKSALLEDIKKGRIRIIAGARSALFLPLADLGLIIIDEEHDDAYKSQQKPRYNARDISLYLGNKNNIKILLGSATPSVSSYENAKKNNYLIRLQGRFFETKKQILFENKPTQITPTLLENLKNILEKKEQAIIFLPTRGNFKTLLCQECGHSIRCPFCSVDMSLHLNKKMLSCHYCGYCMPITLECPNCKSIEMSTYRIGTAQIAAELKELLPEASIAIFDKDHTSTQNKLKNILNDFNKNKIDILVGTQMIAKGHDYHKVNLAIILGIDYLLRSGDYRSYEYSISLLHQIAGRSGRKEDGRVIIQSLNSEFLKNFIGDYEKFLNYELTNRKDFYPPYRKLAMLHFSDKNEEKVIENMQKILNILKKNISETGLQNDVNIVGYGKSGIEKIALKYRYHIFLRSNTHTGILRVLNKISTLCQKMGFEIDIDPIHTF
ncbi:primosomal protein N' [Helicobacter cappadocius]|uniref:Replication restart protein PriA n=1 Tax=Helicobacter cappadocius TaxID=3063998 RepID=A0AA90PT04_9HELI|nr:MULTISPECIES: primosomal protein N' [unclassified Helicobacter]MDO7253724.1 primosomal protein N' [Helicobacter sp. faydin-H75]MDP2539652.1 primosomal protein N' [Helicobacter sp. faydin-H76]